MENEYYLRATGRSYRITNKIIDDLFVKSRGTEILVEDHYNTREANKCLLHLVEKRLHNDFPNLEYKVVFRQYKIYLVRLSELERDRIVFDIYDDNTNNKMSEGWLAGMKRWMKGLLSSI